MIAARATASLWSAHASHLVLLAAWAVAFGVTLLASRLRRPRRSSRRRHEAALEGPSWAERDRRRWLLIGGAALSGAVHLWVMPEHFDESWLYGTFFLTLAIAQITWAAWVAWRPSRTLIAAGAAASGCVIALWIVTRTLGVPVGPGRGATEAVGVPDLLATASEVLVVVAAILLVRTPAFTRAARTACACLSSRDCKRDGNATSSREGCDQQCSTPARSAQRGVRSPLTQAE